MNTISLMRLLWLALAPILFCEVIFGAVNEEIAERNTDAFGYFERNAAAGALRHRHRLNDKNLRRAVPAIIYGYTALACIKYRWNCYRDDVPPGSRIYSTTKAHEVPDLAIDLVTKFEYEESSLRNYVRAIAIGTAASGQVYATAAFASLDLGLGMIYPVDEPEYLSVDDVYLAFLLGGEILTKGYGIEGYEAMKAIFEHFDLEYRHDFESDAHFKSMKDFYKKEKLVLEDDVSASRKHLKQSKERRKKLEIASESRKSQKGETPAERTQEEKQKHSRIDALRTEYLSGRQLGDSMKLLGYTALLLGERNGNKVAEAGRLVTRISETRYLRALNRLDSARGISSVTAYANYASIALEAASLLQDNPSEIEGVHAHLSVISEQIESLRAEMHGRFDNVDAKLDEMMAVLLQNFRLVLNGQTAIRQDLAAVKLQSIRVGALILQLANRELDNLRVIAARKCSDAQSFSNPAPGLTPSEVRNCFDRYLELAADKPFPAGILTHQDFENAGTVDLASVSIPAPLEPDYRMISSTNNIPSDQWSKLMADAQYTVESLTIEKGLVDFTYWKTYTNKILQLLTKYPNTITDDQRRKLAKIIVRGLQHSRYRQSILFTQINENNVFNDEGMKHVLTAYKQYASAIVERAAKSRVHAGAANPFSYNVNIPPEYQAAPDSYWPVTSVGSKLRARLAHSPIRLCPNTLATWVKTYPNGRLMHLNAEFPPGGVRLGYLRSKSVDYYYSYAQMIPSWAQWAEIIGLGYVDACFSEVKFVENWLCHNATLGNRGHFNSPQACSKLGNSVRRKRAPMRGYYEYLPTMNLSLRFTFRFNSEKNSDGVTLPGQNVLIGEASVEQVFGGTFPNEHGRGVFFHLWHGDGEMDIKSPHTWYQCSKFIRPLSRETTFCRGDRLEHFVPLLSQFPYLYVWTLAPDSSQGKDVVVDKLNEYAAAVRHDLQKEIELDPNMVIAMKNIDSLTFGVTKAVSEGGPRRLLADLSIFGAASVLPSSYELISDVLAEMDGDESADTTFIQRRTNVLGQVDQAISSLQKQFVSWKPTPLDMTTIDRVLEVQMLLQSIETIRGTH